MTGFERVEVEPAFVLHARAWRETSEIVEVLTTGFGRVSLVARGMRRPRSPLRGLMQPFQPLALSWAGRPGGLATLRAAEASGSAARLQGAALMSGFYMNELVLHFLQRADPHPELFAAYGSALSALAQCRNPEPPLRRFELTLLAETGYGLILDHDAGSGEPLDPGRSYRYLPEQGPVEAGRGDADSPLFSGAELLAVCRGEVDGGPGFAAARRLLRAVLDHHLAGRRLQTRRVFAAMRG